MKGNKVYPILFKTLADNCSAYLNTELIKELKDQCKNQLDFNNDKLSSEKMKTFDSAKNN